MLGAGVPWRQVWQLFWADLPERLQQQQEDRNPNGPGGMHAQLIIQAQQAVFADVGGTADALRALADELETMDGFDARLMNGRLTLPRQPRWVHAQICLARVYEVGDASMQRLSVRILSGTASKTQVGAGCGQ
jgi:hypothetical protein